MQNFPSSFGRRVWAAASGLVLVAVTQALGAAPLAPTDYRPTSAADFPGLWQVLRWSTSIPEEELDTFKAPYQWYLFSSDGSVRSAVSNGPTKNLVPIRTAVLMQPAVTLYECSDDGGIVIAHTNWPIPNEHWQAYYVESDVRDSEEHFYLRAGDIVMTLLSADGRPLYTRQMRQLGVAVPP